MAGARAGSAASRRSRRICRISGWVIWKAFAGRAGQRILAPVSYPEEVVDACTFDGWAYGGRGGRPGCPGLGVEGRRSGPEFQTASDGREDVSVVGLQGKEGRRGGLVPEGVHAGLHDRVQVAGSERREDPSV